MHFQIAGKHFFRARTGCEPVFLTLNRCHNLFPSLLTVVNYIFWSLNSRDPLFLNPNSCNSVCQARNS